VNDACKLHLAEGDVLEIFRY